MAMEKATLGGGCFWCLEASFDVLRGVTLVESGYCGGKTPSPTYQQVCSGTTGHAEVIQVTFDPEVISYSQILDLFFALHDPTTLNRQGPDIGTQYRSAIFYHDDNQKMEAENKILQLNAEKTWPNPVVTEVVPLQIFYRAEDYHQSYFRNNPGNGYCRAMISPKLTKLRKMYAEWVKES